MPKLANQLLISRLENNDPSLTTISFPSSETIELDFLNQIVDALKANTHVSSLFFLDNHLSPNHLQCIGKIRCSSLIELSIQNNNISDEGFIELLKIPSLQTINASYNNLSDESVFALLEHPNITNVDLSFNSIGNKGIIAAAQSTKLKQLDASGNRHDASVATSVLSNSTLVSINLRNKHISRDLNTQFSNHFFGKNPVQTTAQPNPSRTADAPKGPK
jgi:hypothetical protein